MQAVQGRGFKLNVDGAMVCALVLRARGSTSIPRSD
jgi:hypothetical protein